MSARYSNTSSRGFEIVVVTVTGSTVRILWGSAVTRCARTEPERAGSGRRALIDDPHRVAELRPVDQSRLDRGLAVLGTAQLAHDDSRAVRVDPLADQRGPQIGRAHV